MARNNIGPEPWALAEEIFRAQNPENPDGYRRLPVQERNRLGDQAWAILGRLHRNHDMPLPQRAMAEAEQIRRIHRGIQSNFAPEPSVTRVIVVRQPTTPQPTFWQRLFGKIPAAPLRHKSPDRMMNNNGTLTVPEALVEYVEPAPVNQQEDADYDLMRGLTLHPFNLHRGGL